MRKSSFAVWKILRRYTMENKLFENIYRESTIGMSEVTNEKDLKSLLDAGCDVYAHGTGGFGEDSEAKVIAMGKVEDLKDEISTDLTEEGYDSFEDWFEDNKDNEVIILDQTVGQMKYNYYDLGSYTVEDCNLWASAADVEKYCNGDEGSGSNGVIGTWGSNPLPNGYNGPCPNCGGKVFGYAKLPMNIMHGAEYNICRKCGAMYPYNPWREGEKHDD